MTHGPNGLWEEKDRLVQPKLGQFKLKSKRQNGKIKGPDNPTSEVFCARKRKATKQNNMLEQSNGPS